MPNSLPFRIAAITGASSGLGAELARQLAARGVLVGLIARREPELHAIAQQIEHDGGRVAVAPADVTDGPTVRRAIESIEAALGPIDLLIANAGITQPPSDSPCSADSLERLFRVNVLGAAHAIEAVLPGMLARRAGRIAGVSSLAGTRGFPASAGYSASKAALSTLLEGLRVQLRDTGVGVTTIHPGFVRTPMTDVLERSQPFRMDVEPAARIIVRGLASGRRRIDFPWPAVAAMRLISLLPDPLFDALAGRFDPPSNGPQKPGGQPRKI